MKSPLTRRRQAGLGRGTLIFLVLVVVGSYEVSQFAPPYIRNYQLENAFDDEARRAHIVADDEMRQLILKKAAEIGFEDWEADAIRIERNVRAGTITVSAEYPVEVEWLPGQVYTVTFRPTVDRRIERR